MTENQYVVVDSRKAKAWGREAKRRLRSVSSPRVVAEQPAKQEVLKFSAVDSPKKPTFRRKLISLTSTPNETNAERVIAELSRLTGTRFPPKKRRSGR